MFEFKAQDLLPDLTCDLDGQFVLQIRRL